MELTSRIFPDLAAKPLVRARRWGQSLPSSTRRTGRFGSSSHIGMVDLSPCDICGARRRHWGLDLGGCGAEGWGRLRQRRRLGQQCWNPRISPFAIWRLILARKRFRICCSVTFFKNLTYIYTIDNWFIREQT